MYGRRQLVALNEWVFLQDKRPPIFKGTQKQWIGQNNLARRRRWRNFKNESLKNKDEFSSLFKFDKKNQVWVFDFDTLNKFQPSESVSPKQEQKKQEQKKQMDVFQPSEVSLVETIINKEKEPSTINIFQPSQVPSGQSTSQQMTQQSFTPPVSQTVDTPLRIVNTPTEQPLEVSESEIVVEDIPIVTDTIDQLIEPKKKNIVPYIVGGAIVSLVLLTALKK